MSRKKCFDRYIPFQHNGPCWSLHRHGNLVWSIWDGRHVVHSPWQQMFCLWLLGTNIPHRAKRRYQQAKTKYLNKHYFQCVKQRFYYSYIFIALLQQMSTSIFAFIIKLTRYLQLELYSDGTSSTTSTYGTNYTQTFRNIVFLPSLTSQLLVAGQDQSQ